MKKTQKSKEVKKKTGTKLVSDKEEKTREIIEERVMKTQDRGSMHHNWRTEM